MMLRHDSGIRAYEVSQYLLMLRSRARLTQSELGALMGLHRRSVQKWESGESYPTVEHLRSLIAAYLARGVFTYSREHEEAALLWCLVSQQAPQSLPPFEDCWRAVLREALDVNRAAQRPDQLPIHRLLSASII
jgi:transcriptional regulator with XRE-family HTH domain